MCRDCGCGLLEAAGKAPHEHGHSHDEHSHDHSHDEHDHDHAHDHGHSHDPRPDEVGSDDQLTRTIEIRRRILEHNDQLADQLRADFRRHGVLAINIVGSPGAGKTELLARTLTDAASRWSMAAVSGDLATENDAARLSSTGSPARQILTGTMCHLETNMVADAIADWDLSTLDMLFIENVGNLVCPSDFDLGEDLRVMIVSTTEGEDKPLKYPTLTISADVALINKVDIAEAVECDVDLLERNLREVQPSIEVIRVSARSGEGLDAWYSLLAARRGAVVASVG